MAEEKMDMDVESDEAVRTVSAEDAEAVAWAQQFADKPSHTQQAMIEALLARITPSSADFLQRSLRSQQHVDFIGTLPEELALQILSYLDDK